VRKADGREKLFEIEVKRSKEYEMKKRSCRALHVDNVSRGVARYLECIVEW
jgi:hypothetical protein